MYSVGVSIKTFLERVIMTWRGSHPEHRNWAIHHHAPECLGSSSSLKIRARTWLLVTYSRNETRPGDPRGVRAAGGVGRRSGDPDLRVHSTKLRVKSLLGGAVWIKKIIYQTGEWKYIRFS